ncbi:MAG: hypothetical protein ACQEVT_12415 [Pseudomonadota bacterium]|uniref:hypothetical protein n=1 Tax=Roseovarius sp. TaxID=1486281 RepID=UPI00356B4796
MIGFLAGLGLAVLLGWMAFALLGWALAAPLAVWVGGAIGGLAVLLARNTLPLRGMVALLAPFGVMLPAIALRDMAAGAGLPVVPFATFELLVFLVLYLAFLTSAIGLVRLDAYRIGYAPLPVAVMVLAVCLYGFLTGNWFLPLVAVLGQGMWVSGWGSSNWFDHVTHVLLVPVALVVLILRLI